jgi:hypothetical protein
MTFFTPTSLPCNSSTGPSSSVISHQVDHEPWIGRLDEDVTTIPRPCGLIAVRKKYKPFPGRDVTTAPS